MTLNTSGELWWGLTDIALFIFAVVLGIILGNQNGDKKRKGQWQIVFFCFGAAALFGTLVHTFNISHGLQLGLWVILYIILFEASRIFNTRMVFFLSCGEHLTKKETLWLRIMECVFFAATMILHFALPSYEDALYVFIGFAVILVLPLLYLTFWGCRKSLYMKLMLLSLVLSLVSQGLSFLAGIGVVLGHVFDMIALFLGYLIAKEDAQEDILTV